MSSEVKQDVGKRRLDLLPWDALDLVGDVLTYGINKYPTPKENWRVNSTQEDIGRYRVFKLFMLQKNCTQFFKKSIGLLL